MDFLLNIQKNQNNQSYKIITISIQKRKLDPIHLLMNKLNFQRQNFTVQLDLNNNKKINNIIIMMSLLP
jgi:hypothetical protein